MLRRKADGPEHRYQVSAPYEIDEYPIEENESKNYFERQLSTRYGGLVCLYVCIRKRWELISLTNCYC